MIYTFLIISLFFSAFFSGMEIAFLTSDRLKIEVDKKKGAVSAKIIDIFVNKPSRYIASMLLGNNVALVLYGLLMAKILGPHISKFIDSDFWVLIVQTMVSTILILFAAEFIPKTLFRINPNKSLKVFAIPVYIIYIIIYPLTSITIFLSNLFLRIIFKTNTYSENTKVFGKIDLNNFISKPQQNIEEIEDELKIIQNTLDFDKIRLRECIVPRNEIVAINKHATINELIILISESGYSKIPVFDGSIDNIVGYVHVHGLFKNPKTIMQAMVEIPIVPETLTAQKLFNLLIRKNKSLALVVDEYGGTSGIVSIEDILEEIFGDIKDEHDSVEFMAAKINETTFEFSGRSEIDVINEDFGLGLSKSEDYETLSGYIIQKLERFPEKNEVIIIDNMQF
ncbi:MAG: HlyC/CorC family transporter, partial [Bacteroidales bacterium]|nr:HlyC/CorC family transporter [Bacteroidales bacterium]